MGKGLRPLWYVASGNVSGRVETE